MCDPWDSQGNEKRNAISISIAFSIDFLIRKENISSDERKTKNRLRIIMHVADELQAFKVGWLTQLKKSCHGQTLVNEHSIFHYLSNFEGL